MNYLPETVDLRVIDEIIRVSDRESFLIARRIAREEGLLVGGSSGTAAVAAVKLAKTLPKEAVVVVIFPDSGRGYMSKIFSDEWMIANGFLADAKRRATVGDVLRTKAPLPSLITVQDRRYRQDCARPAAQIRDLANPRDARSRSTSAASTTLASCRRSSTMPTSCINRSAT